MVKVVEILQNHPVKTIFNMVKQIKKNDILVDFDIMRVRRTLERHLENVDRQFFKLDDILNEIERGVVDKMDVGELQVFIVKTVSEKTFFHPDHDIVAGNLEIEYTQPNEKYETRITELYINKQISKDFFETVMKNFDAILKMYSENKNEEYFSGYFGLKTLENSCLKIKNKIVEHPKEVILRESIGIHGNDLEKVKETFDFLSKGYFTHATPTLNNSGKTNNQMGSCFLLEVQDSCFPKSFEQISDISKKCGGVGISISGVTGRGSLIDHSEISNGIIPLIKTYNCVIKLVNQSSQRPGALTVYLEPWHIEVERFVKLKRNTGNEDERARDLFYALWVPDLFMKRVLNNGKWTLFCPNEATKLTKLYGNEFEKEYLRLEEHVGKLKTNKKRKTEDQITNYKIINARDLFNEIKISQAETGTPFMLYKDACNRKSNHNGFGIIKNGNLCTEIIQYYDKQNISVCILASIALPKFVENNKFNFSLLDKVVKVVVRNLDIIITKNKFNVEVDRFTQSLRPIGIGVQGLSDVFNILGFPYESEEARRLNSEIFEQIYFSALTASNELAQIHGSFENFQKSPISQGIFQQDMWDHEEEQRENIFGETAIKMLKAGQIKKYNSRVDWNDLRKKVKSYGLRNSLLTAIMPTASTSQILGNSESVEPRVSNLYNKRVFNGEYQVINKYMVHDLVRLDIWNDEMKNKIMLHRGSIQKILEIPEHIRNIYKTVWEIPQLKIVDMAIERGRFIDQSQSLNIFMESPTLKKINALHFHTWFGGLKTGMYYLRSKPAANPVNYTVEYPVLCETSTSGHDPEECKREKCNPEECKRVECKKEQNSGNYGPVTIEHDAICESCSG